VTLWTPPALQRRNLPPFKVALGKKRAQKKKGKKLGDILTTNIIPWENNSCGILSQALLIRWIDLRYHICPPDNYIL